MDPPLYGAAVISHNEVSVGDHHRTARRRVQGSKALIGCQGRVGKPGSRPHLAPLSLSVRPSSTRRRRLHARQHWGDCVMEPAYLSAFAALAGSMIGALTSLTTSWLTHHVQFRAQQRAHEVSRREQLYAHFIEEASRLYTEAYEHDEAEISKLVNLYALVSKMRVVSSPRIVENADRVVRVIIETYLAPNKTFRDVVELLDNEAMNPLRAFSDACREEMRGSGAA